MKLQTKDKDVQKATTIVLFDKKMANHEADPVDVPHHPQAVLLHEVAHWQFIPPIIVFQASVLETSFCLHPTFSTLSNKTKCSMLCILFSYWLNSPGSNTIKIWY